jgi:hypothetical protein
MKSRRCGSSIRSCGKVKARQQGLKVKQAKDKAGFWNRRRPRYLFSGLMKCGECGGGFVKISEHYFGCATARNKGTCTNLTAIKRDVLEETVLGALQHHLMDPALLEAFCSEYTRHLNRLRSDAVASSEGRKAELAKIDRELDRLIDAIASGVPAGNVKDRMTDLDARKTELEKLIAEAPAPPPVLVHPRMSDRYREEIGRLREALTEESRREEAAEDRPRPHRRYRAAAIRHGARQDAVHRPVGPPCGHPESCPRNEEGR